MMITFKITRKQYNSNSTPFNLLVLVDQQITFFVGYLFIFKHHAYVCKKESIRLVDLFKPTELLSKDIWKSHVYMIS